MVEVDHLAEEFRIGAAALTLNGAGDRRAGFHQRLAGEPGACGAHARGDIGDRRQYFRLHARAGLLLGAHGGKVTGLEVVSSRG